MPGARSLPLQNPIAVVHPIAFLHQSGIFLSENSVSLRFGLCCECLEYKCALEQLCCGAALPPLAPGARPPLRTPGR